MENKEVEDALFYMSEKARREPYTDPELIVNYHRGIREYIELLEQQLVAKDKALDRACEKLTMYNTYEFDDTQTKEDWKEWAEDETN